MEAGLITSTTPAAMTILALLLWWRERVGAWPFGRGVSGPGRSAFGQPGLRWTTSLSASPLRWLGNLLLVLRSGRRGGVSTFAQNGCPPSLSDLSLTALLCLLGLAMFLIPSALYQAASFDFSARPRPGHWWSLVYFRGGFHRDCLSACGLPGVAQVEGSLAGIFTALMPMSALVLSALAPGRAREPGPAQLGGGVLVVSAVACSAWPLCLEAGWHGPTMGPRKGAKRTIRVNGFDPRISPNWPPRRAGRECKVYWVTR